ncbi:DUF5996 family protein, partial [Nodosilinea sp. AN01ver1]|uniref:DUF5996 family protein n=1 Tax=Nodosilinea sp. AN01ver1 TaxID=3423362 RepID=UPI003D31CC4C
SLITAILNPLWRLGNSMSSAPIESSSKYTRTAMALISFVSQPALHLWTQIVGKIRLVQTPWINHSWHVPLYLTVRGLTTGPIPHDDQIFANRLRLF